MTWLWWVLAINWGVPLVLSWVYLLWLWHISNDIVYEGTIWYRGVIPIARFRLISKKSWYAKAWEAWYGFALMLAMIHRDEKGPLDDDHVEITIVHEVRHVVHQILVLGLVQWVSYLLIALVLKAQGKKPHAHHPYENDARAYAAKWVAKGRPKLFNLGERQ